MSDVESRRANAILRLRGSQSSIVAGVLRDLASSGAISTSRVGRFTAPDGADHAVQRLVVELPPRSGVFDPNEVDASVVAVFDDDVWIERREKLDGAMRIDARVPSCALHSVTMLHAGRALQITSFSGELAETEDLVEETLGAPPGRYAQLFDREGGAADSRARALDDEEDRLGVDYGYELRFGS